MLSKKNLDIEGDGLASDIWMDGEGRSTVSSAQSSQDAPVKEQGFTNSSYGHRNLTQDVRDLLTPGRCEQP
jgi:hypothetical protein